MICPECRGKGFVWAWSPGLRCFAHAPCRACAQRGVVHCCEGDREHAEAIDRMADDGCPNAKEESIE